MSIISSWPADRGLIDSQAIQHSERRQTLSAILPAGIAEEVADLPTGILQAAEEPLAEPFGAAVEPFPSGIRIPADLARRAGKRADDGPADEFDPAKEALAEILGAIVKSRSYGVSALPGPLTRRRGAFGSSAPLTGPRPVEIRYEDEGCRRYHKDQSAQASHGSS